MSRSHPPRNAERRTMDEATRWLLAELDLDNHEDAIEELRRLSNKILWALVGILISTATAAVLLALNLTVGGAIKP